MDNTLLNLGLKSIYRTAMENMHFNLEDLMVQEHDAALGNGGLGRLAACFMDSLATLGYAAWGYGIRYEYGMFKQQIIDGFQYELPDYWLNFDNPWEIARFDVTYEVGFYGHVEQLASGEFRWNRGESVNAVAHDIPIPGFQTENTLNLRLWSSKPTKKFDLESFNKGYYAKAMEQQQRAEHITSVLYPNDNSEMGKELRFKQQFFFVSATLQDILRRFKKTGKDWNELKEMAAIHLNDTHPTLAIVELLRILVDQEGLAWEVAWCNVKEVFSFTNHTVLPEALEKWKISLFEKVLPRHLQLIYRINYEFLAQVKQSLSCDNNILSKMSIIEEGFNKYVRMANLAIVGSHKINGVAAIHSDLLRNSLFKEFVLFYGEDKFVNITNGISQRRWILKANPKLAQLYTKILGGSEEWIDNMKLLTEIEPNESFIKEWQTIKLENKQKLASYLENILGIPIDPSKYLFDIHSKRIHEYKRQLMNIIYLIHRYLILKSMNGDEKEMSRHFVPRIAIFSGKAAPGYRIAKLIIKLINAVSKVINSDLKTRKYLLIAFIPDYSVSIAEMLIPASDISQHISTAGMEASGTSNMKFVMNGGLILGTMDGANVEIMQHIGQDFIFIFGCTADKVNELRITKGKLNSSLENVFQAIESGMFGEVAIFEPIIRSLQPENDYYLLNYDFDSYIEIQTHIDKEFRDSLKWTKKSIHGALHMHYFSSDRAIQQYANEIWKCNN